MIYINAVSLANALGSGASEILGNLARNHAPGLCEKHLLGSGEKAFFGCMTDVFPGLPERFRVHDSRNSRAIAFCWEREPRFARLLETATPNRIAVVLGTSTSGSDEADRYVCGAATGKKDRDFSGLSQELGDPSEFLSQYLGLTGPSYTVSTACTSSSRALISGARLIESGLADAVIAGGADTLARMPVNGFRALGALSSDPCRPFTENRHGITIGEASGLVWLSKNPDPLGEGVPHPVFLAGWGESSDGFNMSAPDPEGKGAAAAIRSALEKAGIAFSDLAYVNLHGTGTKLNDAMENAALLQICKEEGGQGRTVPCSSTKNLTGHTLGAAGITEAGLLTLILGEDSFTMPSMFREGDRPDPAFGVFENLAETQNYPEYFVKPKIIVQNTGSSMFVMSNNFAFGGSNTSLVFGREC